MFLPRSPEPSSPKLALADPALTVPAVVPSTLDVSLEVWSPVTSALSSGLLVSSSTISDQLAVPAASPNPVPAVAKAVVVEPLGSLVDCVPWNTA